MDMIYLVLVICALSYITYRHKFSRQVPKGLRLPPGPKGKLIIGNVNDMPTHHEWETVTEWAKKYGNLVYTHTFGRPIIFVNSAEVAHDLFEKRSSLYSDRFDFPMLNDLMGLNWDFALMHYGERWRRHRRMFHQKFHFTAAGVYHDIQTKHTRSLLRKLYECPEDFAQHLRHLSGAIIMDITYGLKVLPKNDPYVKTAETAAVAMGEAGNPGTFLVDNLPFLKHVPEWMPGAGFRKKAREWKVPITETVQAPFIAVKEAMRAGTAQPSILSSLLNELATRTDAPPDEEEVIRNATGIAYFAGSDTTAGAFNTFMLCMVLNPESKRLAQEELDSVVGNDRFPTFEDRDNLPYVNALCKEVLRWHSVVPLGVAHRLTRDDVYGNYFLPGGSIVIGNSWGMLRDERKYGPEPEKFIPERFLKDEAKYPIEAFGFGRRVCPGRHLAYNSLFIVVASILSVFDINLAKDQNGNFIPVNAAYTSGFLSHPEPFKCAIKPRSTTAETLLLGCKVD